MGNFDFLGQSGAPVGSQRPRQTMPPPPRLPSAIAGPQRQPQMQPPAPTLDFAPPTPTSSPRATREGTKALTLLTKVLRFCGYLYLLVFFLSAVCSAACLATVLTADYGTTAHEQIGMWLFGTLFGGMGAIFCFATAELIKLAIRGVQAMEETTILLRSMQRT